MTKPKAAIIIAVVLILLGGSTTAVLAANAHLAYQNRIVPHVRIAGVDVSGLDSIAATAKLQKAYDQMISAGLTATVGNETKTIDLFHTGNGADIAYNLIEWDPSTAVATALRVGHSSNAFLDSIFVLADEMFGGNNIHADVVLNGAKIDEALLAAFPNALVAATATDFVPVFSRSTLTSLTVAHGIEGQTLDLDPAHSILVNDAEDLALSPLSVAVVSIAPAVSQDAGEAIIPQATTAINAAPYTITGTNTSGETETWTVSAKTIADWIVPTATVDGTIVGLDAIQMVDFLTDLHTAIDIQSQNARFSIDGSKVTEFQGSKDGIVIDDNAFFAALQSALGTATADAPIAVPVRTEVASVTTENVNTLGIKEIIGEASTTYTTSPKNRKANIAHGAEKLNGLLIAPGETVSLLERLRPFTIADGYFPELVIVGNEIKPEVAGGLCQIGTTTFRAVMNAGLEVTERRNHSLAISYYNDPSNGNPGTDATLYDPAPDFKFKNDMPTYILLATHADSVKGEVTFTFWGTKDGRAGSYTPPTVLTRSGMGATVFKETTTLAPGVKQCQHGYPGATATFDYTVTYADGTSKVIPYFSSYHSLPETCLVGKAVDAVATSASEPTTPVVESTETVTQ